MLKILFKKWTNWTNDQSKRDLVIEGTSNLKCTASGKNWKFTIFSILFSTYCVYISAYCELFEIEDQKVNESVKSVMLLLLHFEKERNVAIHSTWHVLSSPRLFLSKIVLSWKNETSEGVQLSDWRTVGKFSERERGERGRESWKRLKWRRRKVFVTFFSSLPKSGKSDNNSFFSFPQMFRPFRATLIRRRCEIFQILSYFKRVWLEF